MSDMNFILIKFYFDRVDSLGEGFVSMEILTRLGMKVRFDREDFSGFFGGMRENF